MSKMASKSTARTVDPRCTDERRRRQSLQTKEKRPPRVPPSHIAPAIPRLQTRSWLGERGVEGGPCLPVSNYQLMPNRCMSTCLSACRVFRPAATLSTVLGYSWSCTFGMRIRVTDVVSAARHPSRLRAGKVGPKGRRRMPVCSASRKPRSTDSGRNVTVSLHSQEE